ncbi:MAG TPA: hypothetical protein VFG21_05885 [Xanthomonadaceae bacterium]|nr:hypothetical protein [Xanthomonadaceae bacterium]
MIAAANPFSDYDALTRRHDLMVELYRIDVAREHARSSHEPDAIAKLETYRDRVTQSLARLPA